MHLGWRVRRLCIVLFAVGLIAGCSKPVEEMPLSEDAAPPDSPSPPMQPDRAAPHLPGEAPIFDFRQFSLTSCRWYASVSDLPHAIFPEVRAEQWRDRNPIPLSKLYYHTLDCERLSWGNFERGPIQIARESHSHFTAPEACGEGEYHDGHMATRWLVSDQEVAAAMQERWGVSAEWARIEQIGPTGAAGNIYGVTWDGGSDALARMQFYTEGAGPNRLGLTSRYYMIGADGVVSIDWDQSYTGASTRGEIPIVNGTIGAGWLYNEMLGENYVAAGDVFFDVDITTMITKYGDLECIQVVG